MPNEWLDPLSDEVCMPNKRVRYGALAQEWCGVRLPLAVCRSAAGFYIGTCDPESGPVSRESVEYWPTEAAAQYALHNDLWTQREYP